MRDRERKRKRILEILIILTVCFIWGNSLLSVEKSETVSQEVKDVINEVVGAVAVTKEPALSSDHIIRKLAHVTEFGILAALTTLRLRAGDVKRHHIAALFICIIIASLDETIQLFSHRGSQVSDVGIDTAGAAVGIMIIWAITYLRKKRGDKARETGDRK